MHVKNIEAYLLEHLQIIWLYPDKPKKICFCIYYLYLLEMGRSGRNRFRGSVSYVELMDVTQIASRNRYLGTGLVPARQWNAPKEVCAGVMNPEPIPRCWYSKRLGSMHFLRNRYVEADSRRHFHLFR